MASARTPWAPELCARRCRAWFRTHTAWFAWQQLLGVPPAESGELVLPPLPDP